MCFTNINFETKILSVPVIGPIIFCSLTALIVNEFTFPGTVRGRGPHPNDPGLGQPLVSQKEHFRVQIPRLFFHSVVFHRPADLVSFYLLYAILIVRIKHDII